MHLPQVALQIRMLPARTTRQRLRRPLAVDARRARRSDHVIFFVALVHDLLVVGHLANVRPVVVHAHVADEQHSAILEEALTISVLRNINTRVQTPLTVGRLPETGNRLIA